ncbi:MAG: hypothetical protein JNJ88_21555 [Planctomycetes bacterium]|nr:hypothetical protein [Planctomycetota bacterium]
MHTLAFILTILVAVPSISCASRQFPTDTPALTDLMDGERRLRLALDDDEKLLLIKFEVDADKIPERVRSAARALYPGCTFVKGTIKQYFEPYERRYDLTLRAGGKEYQPTFDEALRVTLTELTITLEEVPPAVRATFDRTIPGRYSSVKRHLAPDGTTLKYGVLKEHEGRNYKVQAAPDGTMLLLRRKMPAEIEVRLR